MSGSELGTKNQSIASTGVDCVSSEGRIGTPFDTSPSYFAVLFCSALLCSHYIKYSSTFILTQCKQFDNGGRFDLRLPYADQGYVDEDADVMGKLSDFFGGGKKKKEAQAKAAAAAAAAEEASKKKKKGGWPW